MNTDSPHEHIGRSTDASIDVIYTERYDDLVSQILDRQADQKDPVGKLIGSEDHDNEPEYEACVSDLRKFHDQFTPEQLDENFLLREFIESLEVAWDDERLSYVIRSENGKTDLEAKNIGLTEIFIPKNLMITGISLASNLLTKIPDLPHTVTTIDLGGNGFTSIDMSKLPSNVENLYISENELLKEIIGEIPDGLKELNIANTSIEVLGRLPQSLKGLDISNTKVMSLPDLGCLEYFICERRGGEVVLGELPDTLKVFSISESDKVRFGDLPPNLEEFNCASCGLTSLPKLPTTLKMLGCGDNNLPDLGELPESLTILYCSFNPLESGIREFPPNLKELYCISCDLNFLPPFPANLKIISCFNNPKLVKMPDLPSTLEQLDCAGCDLTSLPDIPVNTKYVNCSFNRIKELPNIPGQNTRLIIKENPLSIAAREECRRRMFEN